MSEELENAKKILAQIESRQIPPPNKEQAVILLRQLIKVAERCENSEVISETLRQELRNVGAMIPMAGGGTFVNDPPEAIVDALSRYMNESRYLAENRIAELEAQLAEVNADATRWQNRWIEADKQLAELAKQEPVARATGYYGGRSVVEALNPAAIIPVGMALYAAPMPVVQQEPVAWRDKMVGDRVIGLPRKPESGDDGWEPLYATPVVPDGMVKLRNIAAIAHCGGLGGMSESEALVAIRRATLPYFDTEATEEQHRAMIAAAQENAEGKPTPDQGGRI